MVMKGSSKMTMRRRSRSMKTSRPEKKIIKRERNPNSVYNPNSGLSAPSQSNNTRPSRVNPNFSFSGSAPSPGVEVQTQANVSRSSRSSLRMILPALPYSRRALLDCVTRIANARQGLPLSIAVPDVPPNNPFQENVYGGSNNTRPSRVNPSSSVGLQAGANISRSTPRVTRMASVRNEFQQRPIRRNITVPVPPNNTRPSRVNPSSSVGFQTGANISRSTPRVTRMANVRNEFQQRPIRRNITVLVPPYNPFQGNVYGGSNNTRPSRVNPSSSVGFQAGANISRSTPKVTRMASVRNEFQQRPIRRNITVPVPPYNPFQGNVTHLRSPNSALGLMTLSDTSDSSSSVAMPSYQQQHNTSSSSSSMGLPQDYLANASSAVESRHDLSQQTPLLSRGFDLNLPSNDDTNEDRGLDLNMPPRDE